MNSDNSVIVLCGSESRAIQMQLHRMYRTFYSALSFKYIFNEYRNINQIKFINEIATRNVVNLVNDIDYGILFIFHFIA